MVLPATFEYEVLPPTPGHGPIIHCWGEGFDAPFDETFECWERVPASALSSIEVVKINRENVPVANIIDSISKLLITRKPEDVEVKDDEGNVTSKETKWVKADDVERFKAMVDDAEQNIFVPGEDLGDIYQQLISALNRGRPTSRSRR